MLTFNTDNMVHQRFGAFPAPIMDYILKELKPEHLLKLYQCCKFFYHKYRLNIIRHLEIVDDGEPEILDPYKSVICISNPVLEKIKDFWITDSFFYNAPSNLTILPQFSHCTIKKLIGCNYLLWEEYEALAKAGTIEELKIGHVADMDDDGNYDFVSVEKVVAKIPNATSIEFFESVVTSTTLAALLTLDHKAKISNFVLQNITDPFSMVNPETFADFLVKNGAVDCKAHIDFEFVEGATDIHRQLNEKLKEMANTINGYIVNLMKQKQLELKIKQVTLELAARRNSMAEKCDCFL